MEYNPLLATRIESTIFNNEYGDQIELSIFYYTAGIQAFAMPCNENGPWKDCFGVGEHKRNRLIAVNTAIQELNKVAYKTALELVP